MGRHDEQKERRRSVVAVHDGTAWRVRCIQMSKITESARGEECTVRIIGVCSYDPEKTIWSHCRHGAAGKGKAIKALDICGAYACTNCDMAYDQLIGVPHMTRSEVDLDWFKGHVRSLVKLHEKGIL